MRQSFSGKPEEDAKKVEQPGEAADKPTLTPDGAAEIPAGALDGMTSVDELKKLEEKINSNQALVPTPDAPPAPETVEISLQQDQTVLPVLPSLDGSLQAEMPVAILPDAPAAPVAAEEQDPLKGAAVIDDATAAEVLRNGFAEPAMVWGKPQDEVKPEQTPEDDGGIELKRI